MTFEYKPYDAKSFDSDFESDFDTVIKRDFPTFSPSEGSHIMRVMPATWPDAKSYKFTIWVHYSIGTANTQYLCPSKMLGNKCPICESQAEMSRRGNTEEAKKLRPARRAVIWLLDRNNEEEGPIVWSMPWEQMGLSLRTISKDRRTGAFIAIDHPYNGYDIGFDISGKPPFLKYTGHGILQPPTPLHDSPEITELWLDFVVQNPVPETLNYYDYDHLKEVHQGTDLSSFMETGRDESMNSSGAKQRRRSGGNGSGADMSRFRSQAATDHDEDVPEEADDPYEEPVQAQEDVRSKLEKQRAALKEKMARLNKAGA